MKAADCRSVTLSYTRAITAALNSLELEIPSVAKEILSGIDENQRVPMGLQEQLWLALAEAHPDPLLGVKLGTAMHSSQMGLVGYLLMTQKTLGAAIDQLLIYHPLVGEGGRFELRRGAHHADLCYLPNYLRCAQLRVETVLSACLSQTCSMTGAPFHAQALLLAYPAPSLAIQQRYQQLLNTPVQFNAPVSAIRFRPQDLDIPLVAADHQVMARLKPEADALLRALTNKSLQLQVAHLLQQEPQLTREQVASQLCISPRHLGRKLQEENASFRAIQDEVRSHYARQWLRRGDKNNAEIAAALGYCDESAFGKAFRRWTGLSPKAYKRAETSD
ncbi:AraC family transcriptional regulator [Microbulbifer thermotolerans]|uniref:AraC family transcriptional regulator n=2 Tax=Microbulbifer thermotolerans TaxID=252514 RepID=A0AB35HX97_MICTH|nr:AraC family transcriptional regulator [Microbulbifer thermotolerans]MCX2779620.1 AraC family transcriptional regulator [Microbulbifer thermotolerans]MCX2782586.1 AraC family transcriptional regulator [Microbulbifer thermotolerans]MCX2794598.1 AraC family transcriptional regulator [Microbulbifer thermotolerans]MCX2801426.1 AraC family transcriptional regulator [Microbulbifer thermotolerans]MCX2804949.1 AraC family transcriptional regulator [Microbulbifer thermotolerans]